jgi:hypothetical protein
MKQDASAAGPPNFELQVTKAEAVIRPVVLRRTRCGKQQGRARARGCGGWRPQRGPSQLNSWSVGRTSGELVRKQYYFRPSERGLLAWDVDRLIALSRDFPRKQILLSAIAELDETWCGDDGRPTWRALAGHVQLINNADYSFPIILAADGRVMDGRHRIVRVLLHGKLQVEAVQFERDPEPDFERTAVLKAAAQRTR